MAERALKEIWAPFGIEIVNLSEDGGLRCFAITKPKERFTKATFSDLYQILTELWSEMFSKDMQELWNKKRSARFLENLFELYLAVNKQDEIVGFNGWFRAGDLKHINICVDLIGLLPQARDGAQTVSEERDKVDFGPVFLQKTIIERACDRYKGWRSKPVYISTRTQSPVVYRLARKLVAGPLYPDLDGNKPPEDMLRCAQGYAEKLGIKKEEKEIREDLIWKDAYNKPLYERDPSKVPDDDELEKIDSFFKEKLGELDAFILVGRANIDSTASKTAPQLKAGKGPP